MPAMTSLLNGQAVKVWLASISVTTARGSSFLRARAQVAPASPPPTTTTRGPAPCAIAGIGMSAAEMPAAAALRNSRRLVRLVVMRVPMASILLRCKPGGDRLDFVLGEAFGDAVHDRRRPLAGAEVGHGGDDLPRIAADQARHGGIDARPRRMAAGARGGAGGNVSRGSYGRQAQQPSPGDQLKDVFDVHVGRSPVRTPHVKFGLVSP